MTGEFELSRHLPSPFRATFIRNLHSLMSLRIIIHQQSIINIMRKNVKDALYQRMEDANRQRKTLQQQQYVSKSLKRAFAELEEARTTNKELPDASDLFKLIDKQ